MRIGRIRACDVLEDRNNPREDFGDLQKLADSFALNEDKPGEPITPPIVVQDGSKYRIVDGARRFRAMQLIGTQEFEANVCDPIKDQDILLAMLATDDKKPLTDEERCRGVQQALVLGVDPSKVEKAAHISGAAKVKRGMDRARDRAEDMTLDHLLAVAEAETEEQAANIMALPEGKWQRYVREIENKKAADELGDALANWCNANSIPVVESNIGKVYKICVNTVELLADWFETNGRPDGACVRVNRETHNGTAWAYVYADRSEDQRENEKRSRELSEKVGKRLLMLDQCTDAAVRFGLEMFAETGQLPGNTRCAVSDYYVWTMTSDAYFKERVRQLGADVDLSRSSDMFGPAAAVALIRSCPNLSHSEVSDCVRGTANAHKGRKAGLVLNFLLAAKADGCEMPNGWGFLRDDLAQWERDYVKEDDDAE